MAEFNTQRWLSFWRIAEVAAAIVMLWVLYLARYAILLVYVSALLAISVSPLVRRIERHRVLPVGRWHPPRWLAALSVYLGIVFLITGIAFAVVPPLIHQARALVTNLPGMLDQAQHFLVKHGLEEHPLSVGEVLQEIPGGTDVVTIVLGEFRNVVGGIVGVLVMVILSLYLLIEADAFFRTLVRLFPREQRDEVRVVASEVTQKISSWMGGQLILSAIIGCSTAFGLGLLGLPYFYVLAVIAAVGEFIPYAGPVLSAIPGIAIALSVSWQLALIVALLYLAQQQFENHVLVPNLMQHQVGLNAGGVIIAITVGTTLLGILGAILAVPTAAALQVVFNELYPLEE